MWLVLGALAQEPPVTTCCTSDLVRDHVRQYLRFQSSLATPGNLKFAGVLFAWEPMARNSRALPEDERAVLQDLHGILERLKGPNDRDAAVQAMPDITRAVTWLVLRHAGGSLDLVEGWCDGRPWLQAPGPVASPYGCGALGGPPDGLTAR